MVIDNKSWLNKISNHNQLGGIETSVIDNGCGSGTRIAWINTGSGLRYKVVLDRGLDIADAFFNRFSLAWLSHTGVTAPQLYSTHGFDWLKSFSGGLVTTCGLTHIGAPEYDQNGDRGLHDRISNISAQVDSIVQPDLIRNQFEMSISGTMIQSQVLGPSLELKRKISSTLGLSQIRIEDKVTNIGNEPAPLMLLYHINLGWPLVDEGARIFWEGNWTARENESKALIFKNGNDFKKCRTPLESHNGNGEEAAFIDINENSDGICECGISNQSIKLEIFIRFKKHQLPWLTNWQHWGRNEYVTALEPCTHPPIGQAKARDEGTLINLLPSETLQFEIEIEIREIS
ncbi:MAG: aldose 1-epimerase family protein [Cyclobacteriaceae bacterium]|nr:MAG: aldose 1-epimerase family protein [Cyclobacteriaceae bacterium]